LIRDVREFFIGIATMLIDSDSDTDSDSEMKN